VTWGLQRNPAVLYSEWQPLASGGGDTPIRGVFLCKNKYSSILAKAKGAERSDHYWRIDDANVYVP
jgi:hypothetical protein